MTGESLLRMGEVWAKEAYDAGGHHLGRVEAVGFGRDGRIRRVAVPRPGTNGGGLRFISFEGARLEADRLVLPAATADGLKPLRMIH